MLVLVSADTFALHPCEEGFLRYGGRSRPVSWIFHRPKAMRSFFLLSLLLRPRARGSR